MGSIEIEGRRLAWRETGEGPPLLLVNGYAATGADWDPSFLSALAASHRVICPDNRGFGKSELDGGGVGAFPSDSDGNAPSLSVDVMAADLEAVLDAEGIDAVAVVGWSMGGFVAQRLAERSPGRVSALALISTDPGGPGAVLADPGVWARLVDHSGSPREQASRLIELLFPGPLAEQIDEQFGEVVAAARAAISVRALDAQERAMGDWHRQPRPTVAPADEIPTLVVHGVDDVVIPADNAGLLVERWHGASVELVAGAGHAVMAQEPERAAAAIIAHTGS